LGKFYTTNKPYSVVGEQVGKKPKNNAALFTLDKTIAIHRINVPSSFV
jgi:hypothetical protein